MSGRRRTALSADQARRIALHAQGFGDSMPKAAPDRRHLRRVMRRLKLIQLDSVPVVIRTQYMALFARLGPYRTGLLDTVAYRDDEWFEAWSHQASLVPAELEPWLRWSKRRAVEGGTWKGLAKLAADEPNYVQSVLDQVRDRGPIKANELDDPRPREGEWWGSRSLGTLALDWLFRIGAVGVRRVGNFEKQFDLLERIVPDEVLARPTPTEADALAYLICAAASAHGVGTADDLIDYFRLPKVDAKMLLAELVADGRLELVEVQGWTKPAYMDPAARMPRKIEAATLVSPFDPVVWHRGRAERLFGFDYRIEIYVPEDKRVFGYYVMPFLLGDRLVGRFDLKTDRAAGVLCVQGSFVEDHADPAEVAAAALPALARLASLVGVDHVEIADNGNLAPALSSA